MKVSGRVLGMAALIGSCAASCGGDLAQERAPELSDGEFDTFATGGKEDGGFGPCVVERVLAFVNAPGTDLIVLKKAGLHTKAAQEIVAARLGPDGVVGTEDDLTFADLVALDGVKFVGPVAMEQLAAHVEAACAVSPPLVEVIFSPQPFESSHLVKVAEAIDGAVVSVDVAMYSFRDAGITAALARAADRGVQIRMVFETASKDKSKPEGSASGRLEAAGVDVRYVNKIMHHKFAIIDGPLFDLGQAGSATLITGSANWSNSAATRYDENTLFINGEAELALSYQREFNHLWASAREFVGPASVVKVDPLPITEADIPGSPDVEALFTSGNFDVFESDAGPGFSRVRGRSAVSDRLVEFIQGAESSILIGSGHLRSRPVAEALIKKRQERPDVEIRVALDAQEYISRFTQSKEQGALEDCLESVGEDADAQEDCLESGFHFGLDLADAGIDVRYKWYSYRWHHATAVQLHHKVLIIDRETLITGSYNLSPNAEYNTIENMTVLRGARFAPLVASYVKNLDELWTLGEAEGAFESLIAEIVGGSGPVPLVFKPMSLNWEQVTSYRGAVIAACPAVNDAEFRSHPERHFTCERR